LQNSKKMCTQNSRNDNLTAALLQVHALINMVDALGEDDMGADLEQLVDDIAALVLLLQQIIADRSQQ